MDKQDPGLDMAYSLELWLQSQERKILYVRDSHQGVENWNGGFSALKPKGLSIHGKSDNSLI